MMEFKVFIIFGETLVNFSKVLVNECDFQNDSAKINLQTGKFVLSIR